MKEEPSIEITTRLTGLKGFKSMNYESQYVNDFKYRGTLVTNSNRISAEMNHRIGIASHSYNGLKDMLKSRYLKRETKGKLYNIILKPVLMHGSESWALSKGDEQKLRTFQRKVLREIQGHLEKRKDGDLSTIMSDTTYIMPLK
jgi:hypothetical protein